jgi:2-polyprenyl-3-methyl-5-hydroxy-6-metoxy-1,4-benzoquinol methylase
MNALDRLLQRHRYRVAKKYIAPGSRILDIGSSDGSLFGYLGERIVPSLGVDLVAEPSEFPGGHQLLRGGVDQIDEAEQFDCATALAVLEHLTTEQLRDFGGELFRRVKPGGTFVATVPSPLVDPILDVMMKLKLLDGMETEQHHGAQVDDIITTLEHTGWKVNVRKHFQLGLNNLVVLTRD